MVLLQDFEFCVEAQKSVASAGCRGLLISCLERCIYHMHEKIDRRIGRERVPAALCVPALLGPVVTTG